MLILKHFIFHTTGSTVEIQTFPA